MRKLIISAAAVVALAVPSAALAGNSGDGSEYHPQGSECGQYHGAFGAFGKDNNFGVKSDPADPGADGQATGEANSAKGCQRNK